MDEQYVMRYREQGMRRPEANTGKWYMSTHDFGVLEGTEEYTRQGFSNGRGGEEGLGRLFSYM